MVGAPMFAASCPALLSAGFTRLAFMFFAGSGSAACSSFGWGVPCLVCPVWSRWPDRGRCPRPVPPCWFVSLRILQPVALRSLSAVALEQTRRFCRRFRVRFRRLWFIVWRLSVPMARARVRLRQPRRFFPLPLLAARSLGGLAARLRFRFVLV